jgi:hypothetical protein
MGFDKYLKPVKINYLKYIWILIYRHLLYSNLIGITHNDFQYITKLVVNDSDEWIVVKE